MRPLLLGDYVGSNKLAVKGWRVKIPTRETGVRAPKIF